MCNCVGRFSITVSVRGEKGGGGGGVEICGRDIRGLSVCALRRDHIVDKVSRRAESENVEKWEGKKMSTVHEGRRRRSRSKLIVGLDRTHQV